MEITDFEFNGEPFPILKFPHPSLKKKTAPVTNYDAALREIVHRMLMTMYLEPGCGLAANQVGIDLSIFVADVDFEIQKDDSGKKHYKNLKPRVFINPRFKRTSGKQLCEEGCLSFPGITVKVQRHMHVVVEFEDLAGNTAELEVSEFFANCVQHEQDHLDGITFFDRLSPLKRELITEKYLKKNR